MIAEQKKKDAERAARRALADAEALSAAVNACALESVDDSPPSATYDKLAKNVVPPDQLPWGEFFR